MHHYKRPEIGCVIHLAYSGIWEFSRSHWVMSSSSAPYVIEILQTIVLWIFGIWFSAGEAQQVAGSFFLSFPLRNVFSASDDLVFAVPAKFFRSISEFDFSQLQRGCKVGFSKKQKQTKHHIIWFRESKLPFFLLPIPVPPSPTRLAFQALTFQCQNLEGCCIDFLSLFSCLHYSFSTICKGRKGTINFGGWA